MGITNYTYLRGHNIRIKNPNHGQFIGPLHSHWSGDDVGYKTLHDWVLRWKSKPELCEMCKIKPPYDIANISGKYLRDVNDFEWLCRRCHMIKDGRLNKLIERNRDISSKTRSRMSLSAKIRMGLIERDPITGKFLKNIS